MHMTSTHTLRLAEVMRMPQAQRVLRIAITTGIDPTRDRLDDVMPRWSLSPSDMNDLIAYLKQSHDHN